MKIVPSPTRSSFLLCLTIFVLFVLSGCAASSQPTYTFQSKEEVVKEEVDSTPTRVTVQYADRRGVVERLNYLFRTQLSLPFHEAVSNNGHTWTSTSERFAFQIGESIDERGVTFDVRVVPRSTKDTEAAVLNAKNIARFITRGIFERSLFEL